jgi:molecular chaperone Hsp33
MNELGFFRTLLLPESFDKFPEKLSGQGRLSKISVGMNTPYTSIIPVDGLSFGEVVNSILRDSYQIKGKVICSEKSDQSIFLRQLPRKNWDKESPMPEPDFDGLLNKLNPYLEELFARGTVDEEEIKAFFEKHDFNFLISKDLDFKCSCSYERMVQGVQSLLHSTSLEEVFEEDDSIETKCDYCKTYYQIPKTEFLKN